MNPVELFSTYMKLTGAPHIDPKEGPLGKKRLGVINGSSWVSLWSSYFGNKMLPGVKVVQVGNEAVQLHFMEAYKEGKTVPPPINIRLFCEYARQLYELHDVDAILISCSTMNRAFPLVRETMEPFGVPVFQIDEAMMTEAVQTNGNILVVATHGPTVSSTRQLLQETADRLGKSVTFSGATVESAFELLGEGRILEHNACIAECIRKVQLTEKIDVVVLAQLSMSVFSFSYPDPVSEFGIPVLNSAETGFRHVGRYLNG